MENKNVPNHQPAISIDQTKFTQPLGHRCSVAAPIVVAAAKLLPRDHAGAVKSGFSSGTTTPQ